MSGYESATVSSMPFLNPRPRPSDEPTREIRHLCFALLFVLASVLLLSQLGTQTIWSSGKHLTAQPRFWPSIGLMMMLGFGGLHLWQSRSTPRAGSLGEVI
ncbi:MAG: hypothetical protein ABJH45_26770 [Paracoccaceae bacterium]